MKNLYCSLVRPILEYGSILWDPYTSTDSVMLERVQRKFLRFVAFILKIPHLPHDLTPIRDLFQFSSLADRRHEANNRFLSKIISGEIDSPVLLAKLNFRVPARHTRNTSSFFIPSTSTNYFLHSPLNRLMHIANSNPDFSLSF